MTIISKAAKFSFISFFIFLVTASQSFAQSPSITGISPGTGGVGTTVAISGSNFGATQGSSTVTFNGTAGTIVRWGNSQVLANVPSGATTGHIVVTVGGIASNGVTFTVTTAPTIASISPGTGGVGTSVAINGSNFGATQGSSTATFNGTAGTIVRWGNNQLVANVPSGATTGNIVVTVGGVASNGSAFTVTGTPTIASITPGTGVVGTPVTINGSNFGATQGSSVVTFNGAAGTIVRWGNNQLVANVPSGATTGNIVVTISGVASNGLNFTVTPSITSISPVSAPVGNSVTISGSNFGSSQGSSTVTFSGISATTSSWSPTSIVATVPPGATTGNVVVTVSGLASNGTEFTVATLTSLAITPQNPAISIGSTQQFITTGTYSDNSQQNLTAGANWTSSTLSVAAINGSGLATALGNGQTTIQASVGSIQSSTVLSVAGFALTGSLNAGRLGHTATLLNNGTVLIVGGYEFVSGQEQALASAELYNPSTGTFTTTGSLNTARGNFTATLLNDGTVLVAGGYDSNFNLTATAEIYNPTTGVFTPTANMGSARANHSATLLGNGVVLIAGSFDDSANGYTGAALASAELYNPATGAFTPTGSLLNSLGYLTATLLNDGTVLIVGGESPGPYFTNGCELYNPSTGVFTATGSMVGPVTLTEYTATLLNNGMVLVAGGVNPLNGQLAPTAELYNPSSMTFTLTGNMNFARAVHAASLLNDGMVLIEGGGPGSQTSAELYDPLSGTFRVTGSLNAGREQHTSTLLSNGSVLVAGGFGASSVLTSAELYGPATLVPANLVSISVSPVNPSISPGAFQAFTATGTFGDGSTQTLSSVTWSSSDNTIVTITNDSTDRGVALGLATGTTTLNACTGAICGSTTITVNPPGPSITGLAPNSAAPGASVAITGTNFGTAQGSSMVTFNGVVAPISQWSPSSIAAVVPFGATTGNVTVSVSGVTSNGWSFTVIPSLISLTVQPSIPGMLVGGTQQFTVTGNYSDGSTQNLTTSANWSAYNSGIARVNSSGLVTAVSSGTTSITASVGLASTFVTLNVAVSATPPTITAQASPAANSNGWNDSNVLVTFTCSAGSSNVVSCPGPQTVITEGTNQVVSGSTTDSSGATANASVTLNIEKTLPTIVVSSPVDQSSETSATVTATGTVTGSLTAISGVTCNGVAATVTSGSFSCNISLSPGVNLLMVLASDVAGNMAGLRMHLTYTAALPAPTSLQITPVAPFVSVGNTQQFTAVDQNGQPRTDAAWTVDNTSVATISTDSSPTLTGVAAGQVTLTASVGSVSAQAQVTVMAGGSLPTPGSIIWSTPFVSDSGAPAVTPVVPTSGSSLDVVFSTGIADGLLLQGYSNSGQLLWSNTASVNSGVVPGFSMGDNFGGILVETTTGYADIDGTTGAITWTSNVPQDINSFRTLGAVGLDGAVYLFYSPTFGPLALMRIAPDSGNATPVAFVSSSAGEIGPPMVAPDGSIYAENDVLPGGAYLWRMAPDGTTSSQLISQQCSVPLSSSGQGYYVPIPDGQGGILASCTNGVGYQILDTTSGAVYSLTPQYSQANPSLSLVLGADGTAYATDKKTIWSFEPPTGQINWTYQPQNEVLSMFASQGGGVFIVDGNLEAVQIDTRGNATDFGPYTGWNGSVVSGSGFWYAINENGSSSVTGLAQIAVSTALDASAWPELGGEPPRQSASNPTATITVNFTGNKSQGDQLNFAPEDACSQDLGLWPCPLSWAFYIEGVATVSDDASKWQIRQNAVITRAGYTKDTQGVVSPFSDTFNSNIIPGDDNPCVLNDSRPGCEGVVSVQRPSGQRTVYWLDHPGSLIQASSDAVWDSLTENGLFTSKACNRFGVCATVKWYIKLQVDSGSILNCAQSSDGFVGQPIICP
jgi:Glucodextranase, domain B/IPT/TIG domain/Bacterial Ig-like domain (group 2)/Galactose oxidase, central domain